VPDMIKAVVDVSRRAVSSGLSTEARRRTFKDADSLDSSLVNPE